MKGSFRMIIAASPHRGYWALAALYLSTSKVILQDWCDYHLEIVQHDEQHHTFTAALAGHTPHITEELGDIKCLLDFLRDRGMPLQGWVPQEIATRPDPLAQE
jgi:hypothetical protein